VWYNIVLAVVTLIAILNINASPLVDPRAMAAMLLAALAANACFCVGPLLEGYVTWFFGPVRWLRGVVFVVGSMGAVGLTMVVVLASVGKALVEVDWLRTYEARRYFTPACVRLTPKPLTIPIISRPVAESAGANYPKGHEHYRSSE
jgi:hypothetical protein